MKEVDAERSNENESLFPHVGAYCRFIYIAERSHPCPETRPTKTTKPRRHVQQHRLTTTHATLINLLHSLLAPANRATLFFTIGEILV